MLRTDGIEDGFDVLGPLLERREANISVGHPRAAFVEKDQTGKATKLAQKSSVFGTFPCVFDVAEPASSIEQINWAIADHLIGNRNVAASCIARLGSLHGRLTNRLGNYTRSPRPDTQRKVLNYGDKWNGDFEVRACRKTAPKEGQKRLDRAVRQA